MLLIIFFSCQEINIQEAFKWFKLSSDQGNSEAQLNLGLLFTADVGVCLLPGDIKHMHFFNYISDARPKRSV
jgi:hypothetical protein